jgi:NitT/TauT family transport system substrate-binding protein
VEATAFHNKPANEQRVRAVIGKYIKVPPEVLAKMQMSTPGPVITEKQLDFWVRMMKDQEMLRTEPKVATLIAK